MMLWVLNDLIFCFKSWFHRIRRRVLYLLVEIRDLVKNPATTTLNTGDIEHTAIDSKDGFETIHVERRLENSNFKADIVSHRKLDVTCHVLCF